MSQNVPDTRLPFVKMHGLGNDFVIIDSRGRAPCVSPELARTLGDRHRGVGFDQLAELHGTPDALSLDFWNADGTRSGACGNATRCVAALVLDETGTDSVVLKTERGPLIAQTAGKGLIRVNMGQPQLDWQDIPLAKAADLDALPLAGAPSAVGMGNPHCIFFVEDLDAIILDSDGPKVEHDPLFPARTNVEFVQVIGPDRLRTRVWERGTGMTQACGSGACAVAVAAQRRGLASRQSEIILDGGSLFIDWRADGVWMTGPTARVFDGLLDPGLAEVPA
ncbi:MAG: diaminopimelate epimerase [Qingshengfaniella sp.]